MIQDANTDKRTEQQKALAKQYDEVHAIPVTQAEASPAFVIPGTIGDLSQKDRARLIYALLKNLENLQRQNQRLDYIAGYLNNYLVMLTTPVKEQ